MLAYLVNAGDDGNRTGGRMSALLIEGLAKRFGQVQALRGISFAIERGEIFGYLGPNGAGKTTTLRIILGLVRADRGEVRILGDQGGPGGDRTRVGYLPGELRLYGGMTGMALLDHFARFRPGRTPKFRTSLLEAFELSPELLARRVKFLSHGTKQKLGLVLTLQHDPDVWLLDEPTLGLDPLMQQAFRRVVQDAARRERAILLSSHVLSEVDAISTQVAILRAGSLVAVETVASLRAATTRRLEVRFRGPAPQDLAQTAGVVRAIIAGREAAVWIRGDVNPLLQKLAASGVEQVVFPEPELEDIFFHYFGAEAADSAAEPPDSAGEPPADA